MTWLLAAAMLLASPPPISAAYSVDRWEVDHGLPQNSILSMIQTRDGYLWLGTWAGVVRFDGVRFTPVAASLTNTHVTALAEAPDGAVWIGTSGGGVARWQDHQLEAFTTGSGLVHDDVRALAIDPDGRVWVGTLGGVSVIDNGAVQTPAMTASSSPVGAVYAMAPASSGSVWIGTTNGGLCEARSLSITCWGEVTPSPVTLRALLPLDDGTVLVGLPGRIALWTGSTLVDWPSCPANCLGAASASALHRAQDGSIWVGFGGAGGIMRFTGTTRDVYGAAHGMAAAIVMTLFEDAEGSLWAGTDGAGLARLRPTRVIAYGRDHGLSSRVVTSIVEDRDGTIWTGGRCSPLSALGANGRFEPRLVDVSGRACVVAVLAARDGTLWFSVDRAGVYGWRNGGLRHVGVDEGLSNATVASLFEDRDGALWIGTDTALAHRLQGDRLDTFGPDQGLPPGRIVSFAQDRDGQLWLGSNANGLFVLEEGRFRHIGEAEGLPTRLVSKLRFDSRGDLWIGTANQGLYRMREGRFEHFGTERGLPDSVVAFTLEDTRGDLWVSTSRGISRLTRERIDAVADGRERSLAPVVLGKADGLRSLEGSGGGFAPAGLRARDGRLWFSTLDGIVVVDPARLRLNPLPPQVTVEHVVLDEDRVDHGHGAVVEIPAGTRGIEIAYTAFSMLAPDRVRFRYRLTGFEAAWHEAGARRAAFYTNLPPDDYTFEVLAANNDGVWSRAPATLRLTVAPLWWQRSSAQLLGLAVLLALTGGGVRAVSLRRARAQLAALEREQALTRERVRIARDLHDDIGAQLTHLALLADRSEAIEVRAELSATARDTARTMDELVWSVNATNDTLEGLVSYAMRFTERHTRAAGLRCRFDAPATIAAYPLAADARRHCFLAIKEAVNNAVKHAQARELRFGASLNAGVLEIVVADDGRGVDPDAAAGNGLTNMTERMAAVGGTVAIESTPGHGTAVRFRVPLPGIDAARMPMR